MGEGKGGDSYTAISQLLSFFSFEIHKSPVFLCRYVQYIYIRKSRGKKVGRRGKGEIFICVYIYIYRRHLPGFFFFKVNIIPPIFLLFFFFFWKDTYHTYVRKIREKRWVVRIHTYTANLPKFFFSPLLKMTLIPSFFFFFFLFLFKNTYIT